MKNTTARLFLCMTALGILISAPAVGEEAQLDQGFDQLRVRHYKAAEKIFSKIIKNNPQNYRAYHGRGISRYYRKQYDHAIADFTKALVINPQFSDAYLSRGMSLYYKGQYKWAIDDYNQTLTEDPANTKAMNQLAWTLSVCPEKDIRDGKTALFWAKKATELDAGLNYLDTLAVAYATTGDFKAAVETQKRVVARLLENDRESDLPIYLERLKAYRAKKAWRDSSITGKTEITTIIPIKKKKPSSAIPSQAPASSQTPEKKSSNNFPEQAPSAYKSTYPYTIQVGAYPTREKANAIALELKNKGDFAFTSHAFIHSMGDIYRIFMGVFRTKGEADNTAAKLKKRQFRETKVVKKPYGLQVGVFNNKDAMKKMETDLLTKGFIGYPIPVGKDQTKLMIGAYNTRKVPVNLMDQLTNHGYNPKVVKR